MVHWKYWFARCETGHKRRAFAIGVAEAIGALTVLFCFASLRQHPKEGAIGMYAAAILLGVAWKVKMPAGYTFRRLRGLAVGTAIGALAGLLIQPKVPFLAATMCGLLVTATVTFRVARIVRRRARRATKVASLF